MRYWVAEPTASIRIHKSLFDKIAEVAAKNHMKLADAVDLTFQKINKLEELEKENERLKATVYKFQHGFSPMKNTYDERIGD